MGKEQSLSLQQVNICLDYKVTSREKLELVISL